MCSHEMSVPWTVSLGLASTGLLFGFTVWVLVIQPLALTRGMPRPKLIGLQMRVVRAWSRTLIPLTAIGIATALARTGWTAHTFPAAASFAAAVLASAVAIPRALSAGGESLRSDEDHALTSADFLSEGAGTRTRAWHRVVLASVAIVMGGRLLDVHHALASLVRGLL